MVFKSLYDNPDHFKPLMFLSGFDREIGDKPFTGIYVKFKLKKHQWYLPMKRVLMIPKSDIPKHLQPAYETIKKIISRYDRLSGLSAKDILDMLDK